MSGRPAFVRGGSNYCTRYGAKGRRGRQRGESGICRRMGKEVEEKSQAIHHPPMSLVMALTRARDPHIPARGQSESRQTGAGPLGAAARPLTAALAACFRLSYKKEQLLLERPARHATLRS